MAHPHSSTPAQRVQIVRQLFQQEGQYGALSALSHQWHISRQSLYLWRDRALAALEFAFQVTPPAPAAAQPPAALDRAILACLLDGHNSQRNIQALLAALGWGAISLARINSTIADAQQRALRWFAQHPAVRVGTLALDEIFGRGRDQAYLSGVDPLSGVVWFSAGPLAVDTASWTLLLWEAHDQGVQFADTISDGGAALTAGVRAVAPTTAQRRDCWHSLARCAQTQARLDRLVTEAQQQVAAGTAYRARQAAGERVAGCEPGRLARGRLPGYAATAAGVRYLTGELQQLCGVVVRQGGQVLNSAARRAEVETVLSLLGDLGATAPLSMAGEITKLITHLSGAVGGLVACAQALDAVQAAVAGELGVGALDLLGWAWQRRASWGWGVAEIVAGVPAAWPAAAARVLGSWAGAVRASSAVETWHSVLRPHLAVHRVLNPGLLALIAVWHNHRVAPRGVHRGQSPLQRHGWTAVPTDGLVALGYPPAAGLAEPGAAAPRPTPRHAAAVLPWPATGPARAWAA